MKSITLIILQTKYYLLTKISRAIIYAVADYAAQRVYSAYVFETCCGSFLIIWVSDWENQYVYLSKSLPWGSSVLV